MTVYDSSVLIDFLDGAHGAVSYVESHVDDRSLTPPLALFEIYQGEVFKAGPADFEGIDRALGWLTVVEVNATLARAAAELQAELRRQGATLAARDAYIAGAAYGLGEPFAVSDADFDTDELTDLIEIDFV